LREEIITKTIKLYSQHNDEEKRETANHLERFLKALGIYRANFGKIIQIKDDCLDYLPFRNYEGKPQDIIFIVKRSIVLIYSYLFVNKNIKLTVFPARTVFLDERGIEEKFSNSDIVIMLLPRTGITLPYAYFIKNIPTNEKSKFLFLIESFDVTSPEQIELFESQFLPGFLATWDSLNIDLNRIFFISTYLSSQLLSLRRNMLKEKEIKDFNRYRAILLNKFELFKKYLKAEDILKKIEPAFTTGGIELVRNFIFDNLFG